VQLWIGISPPLFRLELDAASSRFLLLCGGLSSTLHKARLACDEEERLFFTILALGWHTHTDRQTDRRTDEQKGRSDLAKKVTGKGRHTVSGAPVH